MNRTPEIEATVDELEKHGARLVEITQGKKHVRVYFAWNGAVKFVVCPLTGSDHRGPLNARATVRRQLGIERAAKRVGARRVRKQHADIPAAELPTRITPGRDPFAPLRLAQARKFTPDQCWHQYFGTLLREAGHEPVTEAMR